MLLNYIITAWRNLLKSGGVSIINIGGLILGLASAILAILFANHELTYENCHKNADRICRLYIAGDFDQIKWLPTTYGPEGPEIKEKFPEVEDFTRAYEAGRVAVRVGENLFFEEYVLGVEASYFSILTFQFVVGEPSRD
jgi:putative ABC transport system permease protein